MRDFFEAFLGILLAVILTAILGKLAPSLLLVFNAFVWIVLYFGIAKHEVYGALMGTVCGLVQDAFSLGVFGVSGLTKTLLGFATGFISRKINVAPFGRAFIFLFLMATSELALWKLLALSLFRERLTFSGGWIFLQPLSSALLVAVFLGLKRRIRKESF